MKRKKPNPRRHRYLPGASWGDVLAGRPVTWGEQEQAAARERRRVAYRCRDCPHACRLVKRRGMVRCAKCGGILDPAA